MQFGPLEVNVQDLTTFELGIVVIGTYELPCVQMKMFAISFIDFDDLYNYFLEVRQFKC